MIAARCISEPISWPRLEQHARASDRDVDAHVAACPACHACLEAIRADAIVLPALVVAEPRRARWWWLAAPALAAAAAVLVLLVRPQPEPPHPLVARVKGIGDVIISTQRERAGVVRDDIHSFAPGDRFHVVVTCPPAATGAVAITVDVRDGVTVDHPLAPATLACGNNLVLPGAFTLTGTRANELCVHINDAAPACLSLAPEPAPEPAPR
jgi:hypothetical protein